MTTRNKRQTSVGERPKLRPFGSSGIEVVVKPSFGIDVTFEFRFPEINEEIILRCTSRGFHRPPLATHCHRVVNGSTWEQTLSPKTTAAVRRALSRRVRIAPRFAMGLDGTRYSVRVRAGFNNVEYTWWSSTPPGWEPLAALVRQITAIARVSKVLQIDWP